MTYERIPGEVNGSWGKFFAFMRQIQGAVVAAAIIGGGTWAIGVGNRLASIETKIDSPNYTLPGAIPREVYEADMARINGLLGGLAIAIEKVDRVSNERHHDQADAIKDNRTLLREHGTNSHD